MDQALEEKFIHQLCNLTEVNDNPKKGLVDSKNHQDGIFKITIPLGDSNSQSIFIVNGISEKKYRELCD